MGVAAKRDPRPSSEKENAAVPRRTRTVSSRYLSAAPAPKQSPPPALPAAPPPRRSHSVCRARPDPPAPTTITRSVSVSFQGASFSYQTAKPPPEPRRSSTPIRVTPKPTLSSPDLPRRWPAALSTRHTFFDGGELSPSSDTDTASSSGSNSSPDPDRHCQERNAPGSKPAAGAVKKVWMESPESSPRSVCSPIRRAVHVQHYSPSKLVDARARGMGMGSPLRVRSVGIGTEQPGNAPSIISFAAEVRRARKGESRIEEAHMLRLLHNRQLQWRFVNARAGAAMETQKTDVEKNLYTAWIRTSGLRDSVIDKRLELQLLMQNLKLNTLLRGQMSYLEDWCLVESDHSSSLSGTNAALKASILRLPVVDGARAELHELRYTMGSTVDVMKAMGSSICSLLPKLEGTSAVVSELAQVVAQEQALLVEARELMSKVAEMHVMQCSLRGQILQLQDGRSLMQL